MPTELPTERLTARPNELAAHPAAPPPAGPAASVASVASGPSVTADPSAEGSPPSLETVAAVADSCLRLMRGFTQVKTQLLALARDDTYWSGYLLINRLAIDGPVRSSELAEKVHADPSTVSRQIATLVKDGYVERRADPMDGRASLLVITDRGREFHAEHMRLRNEHYQRVLADWTEQECQQFAAMTARFTDGIDAAQSSWFADRAGVAVAPGPGSRR